MDALSVVEDSFQGGTVEKRIAFDVLSVPTVHYRLSPSGADSVRVTLTEELPAALSPDDLYFHSKYGAAGWRVDDCRLHWTGILQADAAVEILVGIDADDPTTFGEFVDPPAFEVVPASESPAAAMARRDGDGSVVTRRTVGEGEPITRGTVPTPMREAVTRVVRASQRASESPDTSAESVRDLVADAGAPLDPSQDVLAVRIELSPASGGVRPITLYRELENGLDVLAVDPGPTAIADGDHDGCLDVVVATDVDPAEIHDALSDVDIVSDVALANVTDAVEFDAGRGRSDPVADFDELRAEHVAADGDGAVAAGGFDWPDDEVTLDELLAESGPGSAVATPASAETPDEGTLGVAPVDSVTAEADRTSVAVRLASLESHVHRLSAYADALEEFLDEEGSARTIIEDFHGGLDRLATGLEALHGDVDDLQRRVDAVERRVDTVEETTVSTTEFDATVDTLSDRTDELAADVSELTETMDSLVAFHDRIERVFVPEN